jgi:hypothetical protein
MHAHRTLGGLLATFISDTETWVCPVYWQGQAKSRTTRPVLIELCLLCTSLFTGTPDRLLNIVADFDTLLSLSHFVYAAQGQTGGGLQEEEGNSCQRAHTLCFQPVCGQGHRRQRPGLIQMEGTEAWDIGPGKTASGEHILEIILCDVPGLAHFWEDIVRLIELLQPFSDAINQLECDRPMLSQCHVVLVNLDKHVKAF